MNGQFQPSNASVAAAIVILFAFAGAVILTGLILVLR